ncbi:hypothetical protein, partial [Hominenteromicrobium sp.]|uniref:hypothetical protein n=1 Tax=Hominenteromicrobium sp. TaxID=3073581 RepID=UPI003AEF66FF
FFAAFFALRPKKADLSAEGGQFICICAWGTNEMQHSIFVHRLDTPVFIPKTNLYLTFAFCCMYNRGNFTAVL